VSRHCALVSSHIGVEARTGSFSLNSTFGDLDVIGGQRGSDTRLEERRQALHPFFGLPEGVEGLLTSSWDTPDTYCHFVGPTLSIRGSFR
jgi:hypothetical protein